MKKNTRNILIMLAVLAVLGGAAAALLLLPSGGGEESSSQAEPESSTVFETVLESSAEDVASISVENPTDSFVLLRQDGGFVLEGYEDYDVNTASVGSSANSLLTIHADRNLGSRDNLEDFGLAGENATQVQISYTDGSTVELVLGSIAGESYGRYLLKDGTVYLTGTLAEALFGSKFDYFNRALYSIADRTEDTTGSDGNTAQSNPDILYHLNLSGANFPEPVEIVYDNSVLNLYLMRTPLMAESGSARYVDEIIPALKAPTASAVVDAGLSDEKLEQYGLLEPAAIAEFDLNNESHSLKVSEKDSLNMRYLLLDDRDLVYRVADSVVSSWADVSLMQLRMSYIWLSNIMNVKNLSVTVGGDEVYSFDVTKTLDEEKSTPDDPTYVLSVKNGDGQNIDYSNYQKFYTNLMAIAVLNVDKPEYGGTPAYRVEYHYFDNDDVDVVEYYAVGEERYAVELGGGFNGQVRRSEADKVLGVLSDLNANRTVE